MLRLLAGIKTYSLVGADKWLFNEDGQRHIKGIEALRDVVIKIRKGVVRHGEQLTPAAGGQRGKQQKRVQKKKVVKQVPAAVPTDPFHQCNFTTKEGLQISWKYGNIAQESSDILVSSATSNLNNPTIVGKALNSVGGPSFLAACKPHSNIGTGEIVTTTSGNLECHYVIHAVCCHWDPNTTGSEETLRGLLRKILQRCHVHLARSVAMPLIGTGNLMFPEAVVLRVMREEFERFSSSRPFGTLKTIKLVRYNRAMKPKTVQDRKVKDSTIPVTSSKGTPSSTFMPLIAGEAESVKLQVFAHSNQDADSAFEDIEKFIQSHVTTKKFEHEKSFEVMRKYWNELNPFAKDGDFIITCLDAKTLSIEGMPSKMNEANDKIEHLILRLLREERRANQFRYISKNVQWYYADPLGVNELAFSAKFNGETEAARMDGKTTVEITGSNGLQYVVDFIQMRAKKKRDGCTRKLTRKWIGPGTESPLPYDWTPQREDQVVQLVQLSRSSLEYMEVVNHFASHGGNAYQVDMVERIQNPRLYTAFSAVKKSMGGRDNELRLFHGTDAANIVSINANNFSRSFAGVNGTKYGNGVYFARDASYSMNYARKEHRGSRPELYMAKVLVGNYVRGCQGMKAPPFKEDPNNPGVRYDSVVNDPSNPSIYVIFQDNQCYPEYLITLQ